MTRILVLLSLLIPLLSSAQIHTTDPARKPGAIMLVPVMLPEEVKTAFNKLYPALTENVEWYRESHIYIAAFTDKDFKRVCIDSIGTLVRTEVLIKDKSLLPGGIMDYAASKFPDWESTGKYYKITYFDSGHIAYTVNMTKASNYCDLLFDSQGKFQKQVSIPPAKEWRGKEGDILDK